MTPAEWAKRWQENLERGMFEQMVLFGCAYIKFDLISEDPEVIDQRVTAVERIPTYQSEAQEPVA